MTWVYQVVLELGGYNLTLKNWKSGTVRQSSIGFNVVWSVVICSGQFAKVSHEKSALSYLLHGSYT